MNNAQQIADHRNGVISSIYSSFSSEPTIAPKEVAHSQFEEFNKGHDVFTAENISKFVSAKQDEFVKGLDANEDVESLKKGLDFAKEELSSLSRGIFVDEEGKRVEFLYKEKSVA